MQHQPSSYAPSPVPFQHPYARDSPRPHSFLQAVFLVYGNTNVADLLTVEHSEKSLSLREIGIEKQEVASLIQCIRTEVEVLFVDFVIELVNQLYVLFPVFLERPDGHELVLADVPKHSLGPSPSYYSPEQ